MTVNYNPSASSKSLHFCTDPQKQRSPFTLFERFPDRFNVKGRELVKFRKAFLQSYVFAFRNLQISRHDISTVPKSSFKLSYECLLTTSPNNEAVAGERKREKDKEERVLFLMEVASGEADGNFRRKEKWVIKFGL